ncbi:MAG: AMP-binding protein [Acidimicrobiales bacterium]
MTDTSTNAANAPASNGWTYADIWETVATCIPDAPALLHGDRVVTWAEFDARADGLARYLLDAGCGHQDKVVFYLHNRPEYAETFAACSKAALVHVNTNYRYADDELVYIWDNADAVAAVFEDTFTETIERIRDRVPNITTWLWVGDDPTNCPNWATPYESATATPNDGRVRGPWGRSGDQLVLLYTGGTTGMPKGVMWREDDLFGVNDKSNGTPLPVIPDLDADGFSAAVRARTPKPGPISLPACPLMHGTGLFNALNTLSLGGAIVTLEGIKFSVEEMLDLIQRHGVKSIFIVGDAFAKPILAALRAEPDRWDISSLRVIISSGVMFSQESKVGLSEFNSRMVIVDAFGSSEAIGMAKSVSTGGASSSTASFELSPDSVVITDDGRILEPGSDEIGKVALSSRTPIGYYKDPEKSQATFPTINGRRYSIPGDFATVAADGSITLLGRGSVCINTGGEKVFPEEVEEALKQFPTIHDAIAVGIPDDRFGQAVTAVVELETRGAEFDEAAVIDHVKSHLAHYKAPKRVIVVDSLDRAANGKIDYKRWTAHAESNV